MAIIHFMGAVSGAHLNSAVTLAFAVRRNFPWRRVPGYVLGQVVGGILAALFLRVMFGTIAALGATVPQWHRQRKSVGDGSAPDNRVGERNPRQGLRNTQHRHQRCNRGGRIYFPGGTLGQRRSAAASMNPARPFAPDLVRGNFGTTWIYVVGPAIGALIGVIFEWILKGRPSAAGAMAAQGAQGGDDSTDA
jgi:aquaporin Z